MEIIRCKDSCIMTKLEMPAKTIRNQRWLCYAYDVRMFVRVMAFLVFSTLEEAAKLSWLQCESNLSVWHKGQHKLSTWCVKCMMHARTWTIACEYSFSLSYKDNKLDMIIDLNPFGYEHRWLNTRSWMKWLIHAHLIYSCRMHAYMHTYIPSNIFLLFVWCVWVLDIGQSMRASAYILSKFHAIESYSQHTTC